LMQFHVYHPHDDHESFSTLCVDLLLLYFAYSILLDHVYKSLIERNLLQGVITHITHQKPCHILMKTIQF
jgi:hypothetical protein